MERQANDKPLAGLAFQLPYPPSVNHYYRNVRGRTLISQEGRIYRSRVAVLATVCEPLAGSLRLELDVHPPDRRRRDLDNALKAVLDSLQHAGVYKDDFQICDLHVRRLAVKAGGAVAVRLTVLANADIPR